MMIIFLPVLSFFATKYILFDGVFSLTSVQSNIYAAVVAVIALHLALFLYIYRAYFDTDTPKTGQQKSKKKD